MRSFNNRRIWSTILATIMIITLVGCGNLSFNINDYYFYGPTKENFDSEPEESGEAKIDEKSNFNDKKETTTEKPNTTNQVNNQTEPQTTQPLENLTQGKNERIPIVVTKPVNTYPELHKEYSNVTEMDICTVRSIIESILYTDMSTIERIKTVHDYLIKRTTYDKTYYQKDNSHNHLYNILNENRAVCQGYAVAFYIFMNEIDIPCSLISGYAGENHAWNVVKIDGEWYFIDLTWDDPIIPNDAGIKTNDYPNGDNISYTYFLCTKSFISRNYKAEEYIGDKPTSYGNSNEYNNYPYYKMGYKGVYRINTAEDLNCVSQMKYSGDYMFIRTSDTVSLDTIINKVEEYIRSTNRGAEFGFQYGGEGVKVYVEYKS